MLCSYFDIDIDKYFNWVESAWELIWNDDDLALRMRKFNWVIGEVVGLWVEVEGWKVEGVVMKIAVISVWGGRWPVLSAYIDASCCCCCWLLLPAAGCWLLAASDKEILEENWPFQTNKVEPTKKPKRKEETASISSFFEWKNLSLKLINKWNNNNKI